MRKFKGKYRVDTFRLRTWDYGWNAAYFVTVKTKNREHYFGKINHGKMELSKIGEIADQCWKDIPNHFPFVKLDAHIVMPNHVHGIVIIDKDDDGTVETQNFVSPPPSKNSFGPQSKNLASIIRGFKVGVTKGAKKIDPAFTWQSLYHDHIIRNDAAFQRIAAYIQNNPKNWKNS